MVRIEHIAAALDRMDNWTDYNEAQIRRLLGVDQKKAGVSQQAASSLIDVLYPGHKHRIFRTQVKAYLEEVRRLEEVGK